MFFEKKGGIENFRISKNNIICAKVVKVESMVVRKRSIVNHLQYFNSM
jgi:hypothetical protein